MDIFLKVLKTYLSLHQVRGRQHFTWEILLARRCLDFQLIPSGLNGQQRYYLESTFLFQLLMFSKYSIFHAHQLLAIHIKQLEVTIKMLKTCR